MRHLISKELNEHRWEYLFSFAGGVLLVCAYASCDSGRELPWSLVTTVLALFAAFVSAGSVAGEVESGTLSLLLTRPISRLEIFAAKWVAGMACLMTFSGALALLQGAMKPSSFVPSLVHALAAYSLVGALIYSFTFFVSTQLSKRLDAMAWSAMGSGFLALAVVRSAFKLGFAALAVGASFSGAALVAAVFGGTLCDWRKTAYGLAFLGLAALACVLNVVGCGLLESRLLPPLPGALASFHLDDDATILATFVTRDRPTNLFKLEDTRLVRIDPNTGQGTWFGQRWARAESGMSRGRAWLSRPDSLLGYPLLPSRRRLERLDPALATAGSDGLPRTYMDPEPGPGVLATALRVRGPGAGLDRVLYAPAGYGICDFWPAGSSLALLVRDLARRRPIELQLVDEAGRLKLSSAIPGVSGVESEVEVTPASISPEKASSGAGPRQVLDVWLRVTRQMGGESWVLLRTDGETVEWPARVPLGHAGGLAAACAGGTLLATVAEGASDWHGELARYDLQGRMTRRVTLGRRQRVTGLAVSPSGGRVLMRLESPERIAEVLLDPTALTVQTVPPLERPMTRRGFPPSRWLSERRFVFATARRLYLADAEPGRPFSYRCLFPH